jgi:hypothetical protein
VPADFRETFEDFFVKDERMTPCLGVQLPHLPDGLGVGWLHPPIGSSMEVVHPLVGLIMQLVHPAESGGVQFVHAPVGLGLQHFNDLDCSAAIEIVRRHHISQSFRRSFGCG